MSAAPRKARVGVLLSGRGSNMVALAEYAQTRADCPYEIVWVASDQPDAPGLVRAAELGLPARALDRSAYPHRDAHEAELDKTLREAGCHIVALAGYMRLLSPAFVERWQGRLINIHPSLLPAYPGLDTHARVLAAAETEHGCSVHEVDAGMDTGPVLAQARIPIQADDTPETLAKRVLAQEHKLYPEALASLAKQVLGLL